MAYSTEVKAVLGIDTSKMPEDTRKVLDQFKAAAKAIETESAKSGGSAGEKFAGGLTNKLANAKNLGTTLATALGINLPNLADRIASAIAGGSAEGWKRSVDIAERNAEVIEKIIEAHMNPAQLQAKLQKDLDRAMKAKPEGEELSWVDKIMLGSPMLAPMMPGAKRMLGNAGVLGKSDADRAAEAAARQLKIDEANLRLVQDEKQTREGLQKLEVDRMNAKEKQGTLIEREAAILDNIYRLEDELQKGGLTKLEVAKKENELAEKRAALEEVLKDQKKQVFELEKADLAIAEKRNQLADQRRDLEKAEAKVTDRGKLTVGELAQIRTTGESEMDKAARRSEEDRRRGFSTNRDLSSAAVEAREKAIQIQRLEEDAEQARAKGDSAKSLDLLGQVGGLRDDLVKSGFTKSTEGDPARELREQIAKDNKEIIKTLSDIATTEKGKYINQ